MFDHTICEMVCWEGESRESLKYRTITFKSCRGRLRRCGRLREADIGQIKSESCTTLFFYPTFAVFPVSRETRWARTTGDRVIIFRTRHTGKTSIVATTCNKNIAVSPRKTSITNAAVIVHSIKASTLVKTKKSYNYCSRERFRHSTFNYQLL